MFLGVTASCFRRSLQGEGSPQRVSGVPSTCLGNSGSMFLWFTAICRASRRRVPMDVSGICRVFLRDDRKGL